MKRGVTKNQRKTEFQEMSNTGGGFPGGTVVKNLPTNAGDTGSSPGPRSN